MSLVNQVLPGLYGGVSQQTPELRHDTQVEEMINCYPTVIGGVTKRPPSNIAYNDDTFPIDSFIYSYDRGAGNEKYVICINSNSQYRIFDIVKNRWINLWTFNTYLTIPVGATAAESFTMSTVGDTTFVVNKTVNCAMSGTIDDNGDPTWDTTFYYWVKRTNGDSDTNASLRYTYYIYRNDTLIAQNTNHNSTDAVAGLRADADLSAISVAKGSVLKVNAGTNKYSGADSWGNQASGSFMAKAKKLQDLPNDFGFEGAILQVTGDEDTGFDDFYVKYTDGVWKETFKPGLDGSFNPTTMPHKIEVRRLTEDPTYFVNFNVIEWDSRKVGDEDSASDPSFIGQPIQDVFFYRNRLGFIAGDNVILSESGSYYNFYPTTVTSILDSDPIDVAVDSNKAISLRYATPFNRELLIFGDKAQFVMSSGDTLTPKDVSVQQSTAFEIKDVEPIVLGPNAYFATEKNNYSSVREYYVQPDSLSNDAADITAHCPNYLPKNIIKLAGSSKNDMLFALSADTPNTIYVYNFYWNGEEKAQSAWHKWTFGGSVFNIEVLGSSLLLMIQRGSNINLEILPLEYKQDFTNVNYADDNSIMYESKIVLTKPGFPLSNKQIDNNRHLFTLRSMKLTADYGSFYNVASYRFGKPSKYYYNNGVGQYPTKGYITSKEYNYRELAGTYPTTSLLPNTDLVPGSTTYSMPTDNKYPIVGNVENIELVITNNISSGFRINTIDLLGKLVQKSRTI